MTRIYLPKPETDFLRQSNLIEGEPDTGEALQDAKLAWLRIRDLRKLTEKDILECHKILMKSRDSISDQDKGEWSRYQTRVGRQINPEPYKIPALVSAWVEDLNDTLLADKEGIRQEVKEELVKKFHIRYERIHPFCDGNGRTGRIFYEWHRLQLGLPIYVIQNKYKREYYSWFEDYEHPSWYGQH